MSKILVTGSGGYIGRHIVKTLLDMGHSVIAADFNNDDVDDRSIKINESIFNLKEDAYKILNEPDVCLHMAWRNGFVHNASTHMEDLSDHFTFLKNMIDGGLKKVAVMGTMHEIGYWEGAIDENTPCNPLSLYGVAKNALRQALIQMAQSKNVDFYWLRAFYILGDDLRNHSLFSKIIKMEDEGKKTFPFTSGKNLYDFISVDELAKQIAMSITQKEITGIINVCTGKPVSLSEKVNEFISQNNLKIRPQYGAFPDREYDSPGIWGDATKINKIIKNFEEQNKCY